jgi:hypothetical protein
MAKKGSKNQSKWSNTANNTAPLVEKAPTPVIITTSQPTNTTRDDEHTFFNFITLATTEDIKIFLKLASTTQEGRNLENLWRRAHEEGYEKERKSLLQDLEKKLEDRFEEGVERGMDLGREQGYTVAKEGFDGIIKELKAREASKTCTINTGTQTDTPTATTTSISIQTSPTTLTTTSQARVFVQLETESIGTQTSGYVVQQPSSSSIPVSAAPSTSTATTDTQTEATTPQHLTIALPAKVAASQFPGPFKNGKKI